MDHEIDVALGKLLAGEDGREVLRELVGKVGAAKCSGCGRADVLCFHCKAAEVLGEKALGSAPTIASIAGLVKKWWSEREDPDHPADYERPEKENF